MNAIQSKYFASKFGRIFAITTDAYSPLNDLKFAELYFDHKSRLFNLGTLKQQSTLAAFPKSAQFQICYASRRAVDLSTGLYETFILLGRNSNMKCLPSKPGNAKKMAQEGSTGLSFCLFHPDCNLQFLPDFEFSLHDSFITAHSSEGKRFIEFHIIDGPMICCFSGGKLFLASRQEIDTNAAHTQLFDISRAGIDARILRCEWSTRTNTVLAIMSTSKILEGGLMTEEDAVIDVVKLSLRGDAADSSGVIERCSNIFIPAVYASILRCVCVVECRRRARLKGRDLSTLTYACTSNCQLILCQDGSLIDCLSIPYNDMTSIEVVDLGTCSSSLATSSSSSCPSSSCLILLQSQCRNLVVVNKEKFTILYSLDVACHYIIDDFVGCGSDQLLIFPNNNNDDINDSNTDNSMDIIDMLNTQAYSGMNNSGKEIGERFLLTDWCGVHVDKMTDSVDRIVVDLTPTDNLKDGATESQRFSKPQAVGAAGESNIVSVAVAALESRLCAGQTQLNEARRAEHRKWAFLKESCDTLQCLSLDNDGKDNEKQTHLVNLVNDHFPFGPADACTASKLSSSTTTTSSHSQNPYGLPAGIHCDPAWQRIIEGQWIVGLRVHNDTRQPMHRPQLTLVAESKSHALLGNKSPRPSCSTPLRSFSKCFASRQCFAPSNCQPFDPGELFLNHDVNHYEDADNDDDGERVTKRRRKEYSVVGGDVLRVMYATDDVEAMGSIVAVVWTDVPRLNTENWNSFTLLLSWSSSSRSGVGSTLTEFIQTVRFSTERINSCTLSLLRPTTEANPKLDTVSLPSDQQIFSIDEDLLALDAVQSSCIVQIKSSRSHVFNILTTTLTERMGFRCVFSTDAVHRKYVYTEPYGSPLFLTRISIGWEWDTMSQQAGYIEGVKIITSVLSARDVSQLLLLVHMLYDHLPDDVIILPANQDDLKVKQASSSMHKELTAVSNYIRTLARQTTRDCLSTNHTGSESNITIPLDADDAAKFRDDFSERRKNLDCLRKEPACFTLPDNDTEVNVARQRLKECSEILDYCFMRLTI